MAAAEMKLATRACVLGHPAKVLQDALAFADRLPGTLEVIQDSWQDTLGIDIELQDAPIKDVLLLFSDIGRVNIIAGPEVQGAELLGQREGIDRAGKTTQARLLCEALAGSCGIAPSDVMVSIVENTDEDWSFGLGRAQFLTGEL